MIADVCFSLLKEEGEDLSTEKCIMAVGTVALLIAQIVQDHFERRAYESPEKVFYAYVTDGCYLVTYVAITAMLVMITYHTLQADRVATLRDIF